MHIHLIAIGKKMPDWITAGYEDYAKRLQGDVKLTLIELASPRKSNAQDAARVKREEGEKLLAAIPNGAYVITLDEHGKHWDSPGLATQMTRWAERGQAIALLIGGADGLDQACLARADQSWSLSKLTLPHAMVRVMVAEQLYRAWSLNNNHPYHRA